MSLNAAYPQASDPQTPLTHCSALLTPVSSKRRGTPQRNPEHTRADGADGGRVNTQSPDTPDPHTQRRHRVCLRHTGHYRTKVTFCERVIMQMHQCSSVNDASYPHLFTPFTPPILPVQKAAGRSSGCRKTTSGLLRAPRLAHSNSAHRKKAAKIAAAPRPRAASSTSALQPRMSPALCM